MLQFILGIVAIYLVVNYIRNNKTPNYQGKTVWITGASSGIGEYLAYEFNKYGAHVILSARNVQELQRVKKNCSSPERAQVLPMDMVDYVAVTATTKKLGQRLQSQAKTLDVVVQNAGVSMRCEFVNYSFENHQKMFDLNVHGPYNHLKAVVPILIKQNSGKIVGISSVAGKLAPAYRSSYAGSKHALIGIMDTLRTELRPNGIKVCNIMPGYIKTNVSKNAMAGGAGQKFGKTDTNIENGMEPDVFARQAVSAIFNDINEICISDVLKPKFGIFFRNLLPDFIFYMLYKNAANQSRAVSNAKTE